MLPIWVDGFALEATRSGVANFDSPMRKITPLLAPAVLVIIGIIFFLPSPERDRPPIVFRPDPPETISGPPSEPVFEAPEPQRLLPPDKPPVTPWEIREKKEQAVRAADRTPDNESIVFVKPNGKRYHKETCQFAKGAISVKKIEALAHDYTACAVCGG